MIHYDKTGADSDRPTLVFVHGLTCAADDWSKQVAALSPTHRCISVDLRGHGRSNALPPPYDIETMAADVVAILRKHEICNSILIGHSMGTRVITAAHIQAPEHIDALIYVDGSKQAQGDPQAALSAIQASLQNDDKVSQFVATMFDSMFTERSDPAARKLIIERAVSMPVAVFRQLLANLLAWDAGRMVSALQQVKIPLTVIQSTNVDANRVRHCLTANQSTPYLQLLQQHVSQAKVLVAENTGHFTQLDAPDQVNDAIAEMSALISKG